MTYSYRDNYKVLYSSKTRNHSENKVKDFIKNLEALDIENSKYKLLTQQKWENHDNLEKLASKIKKQFKYIVIIGIGGSALNPKLATSLRKTNDMPIYYLDTTDPFYYESTIAKIDLKKSFFLIISKSGNTIEIISILGTILHDIGSYDSSQFCFITGSQDSPIRSIAKDLNAEILTHDENIGGRFSTFTNVAILPGLLCGCNMENFIKGGNQVLLSMFKEKENSLPAQAAITAFLSNKPIIVNIGYIRSLIHFFNWHSQIIAESLGKNGKGYTPVQNIGPIDQHSMFQLYLDGPKDKLFTFLYKNNISKGTYKPIPFSFLNGKTLDDINEIEYKSTLFTCQELGLITRNIVISDMDEYNLGALAMHSIIEVIILAHLLDIEPFGQPAVEKIKLNINKLL